LLLALQLRSYICVPLSARGRVFGALTVVNSESNRIYTHDDVALAEELGRRAGVAVDHARLFDAARRSEERFRLATEAAGTFAWECQLQTGGIEWSENAARVIGCVPTDLPTDMAKASFFIAPEERERIFRQNDDALEKGLTGFKFEFRGIGEPATAKRWESQGQIIYDGAGKPLRLIGITQDVSERVKAQERLKQAVEEHLRDEAAVRAAHQRTISVLNLMSDCYIEMDSDWRLTFVNAAAARFNGFQPQDVLGKTHWEVWPAANGTEIERNYRKAAEDKKPFSFESYYGPLSAWVEVHAYPTDKGLAVYFRDITEAKRTAEEKEQLLEAERAARSEAERISRMKDEFLATLSHELRTPLNSILGWSQILERGERDFETVAEGIAVISRNARAQTQLIEDLLDMSRIISGKLRLDVRQVNIGDVVTGAVEAVMPSASAKNLRIQVVADPLAGPVSGDPSRLQQVVWNLLTNAVKFTPKGGEIQVVAKRVNSHIEIVVSDNGTGIAPDFLPFVFDRFRQADSSTSRRHGGLGIGLALVKQITELHGGSVRVKSAGEGNGSTFTIILPLSMARLQPEGVSAGITGKGDELLDETIDLEGARVLFVDDDFDARNMCKRILSECKAEVMLAASAAEAITLLKEKRPDVLVSDIGMPQVDGYQLILEVRRLPDNQGGNTPAAALTAFARSEDRRRALMAGYESHIAKPVKPAELIAVVASLAGRMRRKDQNF
jgi:PAS domain S-box-containing protein